MQKEKNQEEKKIKQITSRRRPDLEKISKIPV